MAASAAGRSRAGAGRLMVGPVYARPCGFRPNHPPPGGLQRNREAPMRFVHPAPTASEKLVLGLWIATAASFLAWVLLG